MPTCVPNTGSGNRGKRCCGPVFHPFPDNGRKQICEGRAAAGGHDINLYVGTQSWEGSVLQEGRGVYQAIFHWEGDGFS